MNKKHIALIIAIVVLFALPLVMQRETPDANETAPAAGVTVTPNVAATPEATLTPTPENLLMVGVEDFGWINNNNCTIGAVVENTGTENVRFQLMFNGVSWTADLDPKGKRSAEISLPFGNIGRGELLVHITGDVNQTNRSYCSESSSSSSFSSDTITSTNQPTPTPAATISPTPTATASAPTPIETPTPTKTPPQNIPEFPTIAMPIVAILSLLVLWRKK